MPTTLTTTDAFFVAYQERAGITMHLGAELVLDGALERTQLEAAIVRAIERWPALACTLAKRLGGLAWRPAAQPVLAIGGDVVAWRNTPIDPFREPPFGVMWVPGERRHVLAFRCHHAVADGMLFLAIVGEIVGGLYGTSEPAARPDGVHPLAFVRLRQEAKLGASWRHARTLAREARDDRSARIALRAVVPGDTAICDRRLDAKARAAIARRAASEDVRPPWLAAAAWLRAVYAWNARRGVDASLISVEVPVSMRRGPHAMAGTGNHLTVLTLFGDARAPLGALARSLWEEYAAAIRRRDHLAVPLLGAPARLLPWRVFRRVAVTTTSTGFATTHFTWIEHARDFRAELAARSGGALVVREQQFYTPVCLRMGAALGVMAWPDAELQLSITYRETGLAAAEAAELADLVVAELA